MASPRVIPTGPPATARDALRRLEAVRTFDGLVQWSHDLRRSGLLGEDGYTNDLVKFWGRVWPGEVPPQAVSRDLGRQTVQLPSGERVEYIGGWKHGQWRRLEPLSEAA
jgi:hypothetical protein